MSKLVKELITKDLSDRYRDKTDAVWVELVGVDGITTNQFRRDLRSRQMQLEIVKTSLMRRACEGMPLAPLAERLHGPAALVTGGDSAVDVAKLLEDWKPKFPKESFRLRGAMLDGTFIDERAVQNLAKMPTKQDVQAEIVQLALSPGSNLVRAFISPGANIAGCLKAMIAKLEDGETIGGVAAAPAAAVEAAPAAEATPAEPEASSEQAPAAPAEEAPASEESKDE